MRTVAALIVCSLVACKGSKSAATPEAGGSGSAAGTYVSVANPELTIVFKPGGEAVLTAAGMGSSKGTYRVEGEKIIATVEGRQYTFIKDGNCIQDLQQVFDKSCIGGAKGEASNASTHTMPEPAGVWVAKSSDGEFTLTFTGGNKITLAATPPGGTTPQVKSGTFRVEGDVVQVTTEMGDPLTLQWVNGSYESTSFGFPMKFVKQN